MALSDAHLGSPTPRVSQRAYALRVYEDPF